MPPGMTSESIAWVQCDDTKCMKWRKVPKSLVSSIENSPWFCHMNPDKEHASCFAEQEEMKVPKGEKFVFSLLQEGSLVWAKICGYPRWPSIICSDIVRDNFACFDHDGDVTHYHVEYFGDPRTHSWVLAKDVEIYGSGNAPAPLLLASHKGMKNIQSRKSFQKAIMQADRLTLLKPKDRLQYCFFQPTESLDEMDNLGDCPYGSNHKINATQKKLNKANESKIKSESVGSNERDQLEIPSDPDSKAESAKIRMRRRKRMEADSIKSQEQLDADGRLESERRKKIVKKVDVKNNTGFDSTNAKHSLIYIQANNKNKIKFDGLSTCIPAISTSQIYPSSSLLRKTLSNPCENGKQASFCLLNINGVVVPAILPNNNLNCSPSTQNNIFNIQANGNANSSGNSTSFESNQSESKLEENKESIEDIEGQSLLKIITQSNEEQSCTTRNQVSAQSNSSSEQDNTTSLKDKNMQNAPIKIKNKSIITINISKTSKNTVLVTSAKELSSLSGPIEFQNKSNTMIEVGCSRKPPGKDDKNEIQNLNLVTQEANGDNNLTSSKSKENVEENSRPIHKITPDKQLSDSAKSTLTMKELREPRSMVKETLPTDKNMSEGVATLFLDEVINSNNSRLKDESQFTRNFKTLFKQYADMQKLEENERCIKVDGKTLDLCSLYSDIQKLGGFNKARDKCWESMCKRIIGDNSSSKIPTLKEIYRRTLLPFEEYLQSLNINPLTNHPVDEQRKENQTEIDPEKKYVMENRLAKGHLATNYREGKKQPENNQVRKDMAEKEWEKTNWAQKDRTTMDDKEECYHDISQEENGDEEDILYTLINAKACCSKKIEGTLLYNDDNMKVTDSNDGDIIDELMEIGKTNDTQNHDCDQIYDEMEELEDLQMALTNAELSLYFENNLPLEDNKMVEISSELKSKNFGITEESSPLFQELDALEESIAAYASILD